MDQSLKPKSRDTAEIAEIPGDQNAAMLQCRRGDPQIHSSHVELETNQVTIAREGRGGK
jgi:hypothetical protein